METALVDVAHSNQNLLRAIRQIRIGENSDLAGGGPHAGSDRGALASIPREANDLHARIERHGVRRTVAAPVVGHDHFAVEAVLSEELQQRVHRVGDIGGGFICRQDHGDGARHAERSETEACEPGVTRGA
jgi:hypothetical protein